MALSLQEQLLKAGLADKQKAQKVNAEKRKQSKAQKKHKVDVVNENKVAAEQARQAKIAKDKELNEQLKLEADKKAIAAQIKQLIEVNCQPKNNGDVACNFTDGSKIKTLYVDKLTHKRITQGKLAIVKLGESYEIVPTPVADKIAQRNAELVLHRADKQAEPEQADKSEEDDWYAEYEIPDDLMW
ncbi:DUF2058 domain-containing protein [Bowmanella yangjiangensis]|uniref:DUF2058 domain-containing protein n=1 Tax=Bowmanella yangjiangensis TaxID=2811230 RepID=A0ABS3CXM3_9ALTE|nr:DUF2058 domain-containing protein [Bowmanella yangjiangensis]MBN7821141.1 DUF2058 domain-containing protein [Bowmanella yangjiangensis]